jgi:hypothetical protein
MSTTREQEYKATAVDLADAHRKEDPKTSEVFLFPDPHLADVRLLEVSGSAPRSGDVLPFRFAPRPDLGVNYASTVILLSPDEWSAVLSGSLPLPPDWDLSKREKL